MPLMRMPNGEFVDIADGTPADVIARIKAQYSRAAAPVAAVSPQNSQATATQKEVDALAKLYGRGRGIGGAVAHAASFGLDDMLASGVNAGVDKLMGRPGSLADRYHIQRAAMDQSNTNYSEAHPYLDATGNVIGALGNPVGAETGVERAGMAVAPSLTEGIQASKIGSLLAKVGNSGPGLAARAGFNYGAIDAALNSGSPSDIPTNALRGGLTGGAWGGALGAVGSTISHVGTAVLDRSPENADRVAYSKIAGLLDRSRDPTTGQPFTPASATNEMNASIKGGSEPMIMDLSPEMQAMGGYLSRKPGFSLANELPERAEIRSAAMPDRFDSKVNSVFGNKDAYQETKATTVLRKAQGNADYAIGGAMDAPIKPSTELDQFLAHSTPNLDQALKDAYMTALNRRELPATLNTGPDGSFTHIPTMRVFDYVKRDFDTKIGMAMRAGNSTKAGELSQELSSLKGLISQANPEYEDILSRQKDLFQKKDNLELGQSVLRNLRSNDPNASRALLDQIKQSQVSLEDLRIGFADALLQLREKSDNPAKVFRQFLRSDNQRSVMQYIFGSNKTLADFNRFLDREGRGLRTDNSLIHSRQSITSTIRGHADADEMQGTSDIGKSVLQGFAFGGTAGAMSRGIRAVDMLYSGLGPAAQEKLANILMGQGQGLEAGVKAAKTYEERRAASAARRSAWLGKTGAVLTSGLSQE